MRKILLFLLSFTFLHLHSMAQLPGNGLHFDGTNDHVQASLPSAFSNLASQDITVEFWMYPNAPGFSRAFYAQVNSTNVFNISYGTGQTIFFYVVVNGTTYSVETGGTAPLNQWTHVACRWTAGTLTPEVFFNGVLQATSGGGGTSVGTVNNSMFLGCRPGGAQFFNGIEEELRVWSTARSNCAISANMNRQFDGPVADLLAVYHYDVGTAGGTNTGQTTLPDLSGNAYNGTLNGFALSGSTSNWVASGANITAMGVSTTGASYTAFNSSVCSGDVHVFPDGGSTAMFSDSLYMATLLNFAGCDSIVTDTVTVLQAFAQSMNDTICEGSFYSFPDGSGDTLTGDTVQVSTLMAANGCDSIVTTSVSVSPSTQMMDTLTTCQGESVTLPDGTNFSNLSASFSHTSSFSTAQGCDSTIQTYVRVNTVDTSVAVFNNYLEATSTNYDSLAWLECDNGNYIPTGWTTPVFTGTSSFGYYALAIWENGCTDTSACHLLLLESVLDPMDFGLSAYPNPAQDRLFVQWDLHQEAELILSNPSGQIILRQQVFSKEAELHLDGLASGIYFLRIQTDRGSQAIRLVKL